MGRLGSYLKTLGFVSALLVGLGLLLEAISAFVVVGYIATSRGYSFGTADGVWVALVVLLLIISFMAILSSMALRRGNYPGTWIKMILMLAAVALIVQGAGMYAITTSNLIPGWNSAAALAISAGAILIFALFISMGSSMGMKLTGSILALVFAVLLIVKLAQLPGAQAGGGSLSGGFIALAAAPSGVPGIYYAGVSAFGTYGGILGTTYLVLIAYLVVALALLLHSFMSASKMASIAWIIALVGFLLYGIDTAWGNINALTNVGNVQNWGTGATPVVTAVILTIASFLVMVTSVIGMVHYGASMGGMMTGGTSPSMGQPMQTSSSSMFCPNCGTENPPGNAYCKKCGTKLG